VKYRAAMQKHKTPTLTEILRRKSNALSGMPTFSS
jgi:hypothetical protein